MDADAQAGRERRPVAAWTATDGSYEAVVCDDGSVFYRAQGGSVWERDYPIPGTRAALATTEERAASQEEG